MNNDPYLDIYSILSYDDTNYGTYMSREKWDKYFLNQLEYIKTKSKDPSTKVASIIVGKYDQILVTSYNGFPRKVQDDILLYPERYERPLKYSFTVHAEANAIAICSRTGVSLDGARLYCNLFPCVECAKLIIQSGIVEIISYKAPDLEIWNFELSKLMFNEANIKVIEYEQEIK